MKNKISLLAFVNQPLPRRAIAEYESVFAAAYGECRFEQFTDSRELFLPLPERSEIRRLWFSRLPSGIISR